MALPFLCDELMVEILSWLPVRSLMQCRCVSKSFQSLISDPSFVKLHLHRSPKNTNFLIRYRNRKHDFALPCSLRSLLEDPLSDIALRQEHKYKVAGSCNGLVLLFALSNTSSARTYKFLLWNPAIRKTCEVPHCIIPINPNRYDFIKWFGFGYDNLSDTYKVVIVFEHSMAGSQKLSEVKVCNLGDNNCWRKIQSLPPYDDLNRSQNCCGVYLNGTLNWIVTTHYVSSELVLISLDLGSETYTQFLLPRMFEGYDFRLLHLKDCLSLSFVNSNRNRFCIWQMKEFGNQNSWTPLLNLSLRQDLQISSKYLSFVQPLCMFENGCLLVISTTTLQAILYDGRDNTVKHSKLTNKIFQVYAMNYVQSLVLPRTY
uniref:F-box/kelch-repeat protein At3g06240 family n=1 Tax=Cajanus cajan TaxID=3821 RepID=A0A151T9J6_CAJCA|nr:F-box/kelch-repeat protein At3g06240 family [Cajanus cajan]